MSNLIPPNSRETHDELAASGSLDSVEKRRCQTAWISRTVTTLSVALVVAVGTAFTPTDTFAESAPAINETRTDPTVTQNFEAEFVILFEKVSADLDLRLKAKTDAIAQQAAEEQIAKLLRPRSELANR